MIAFLLRSVRAALAVLVMVPAVAPALMAQAAQDLRAIPAYEQAGNWAVPLVQRLSRLAANPQAPLALEFEASPGQDVLAPAAGDIVFDGQVTILEAGSYDAGLERYAGHGVVVRHRPGIYYLLSSSRAWASSPGAGRVGTRVERGEVLGQLSRIGADERGKRPNLVLGAFAHDPSEDFAARWRTADPAGARDIMPRLLRGTALDMSYLVGGAVLQVSLPDDIDSDAVEIRINGVAIERFRWRERTEFVDVLLPAGPHELVIRHGYFIFKSEYRTLIQMPDSGLVEQALRLREDRVVATGPARFRSRLDETVQALRQADHGPSPVAGSAPVVGAGPGSGVQVPAGQPPAARMAAAQAPPASPPQAAPSVPAVAVASTPPAVSGTAGEDPMSLAALRAQAQALALAREELERDRQMLEQQRLAAVAPPPLPVPAMPKAPALRAHALVIGNGAYAGGARLANPSNDAREIARMLRELGFDVTEALDADRAGFVRTLSAYARHAAGADVSVFFYAGHGVQVHGVNYIVPVDFDMRDPDQIIYHGISLNAVVEQSLPGRAKLVFLDACRDNPMQMARTRGISPGLAPISVAQGTLIAYATKDGSTAEDGRGRHSPFTAALLEHLHDPDDIAVVLRKVREKVMRATGGRQQPWEYGSLTGGALVLSQVARPR